MKTKTKKRFGYKVVVVRDNKRLSAYTSRIDRLSDIPEIAAGQVVTYVPMRVTKPIIKGTKLFAFLKKGDAKKYSTYSRGKLVEVWRCELRNPIVNGWLNDVVGYRYGTENNSTLESLIRWFEQASTHPHSDTFPSCCVCDSVKLLKKVK